MSISSGSRGNEWSEQVFGSLTRRCCVGLGRKTMVHQIVALLFCIYLATRLRPRLGQGKGQPGPWALARRSLRWGIVLVTVPVLGYFGVMRYVNGQGIPSTFWVVVCTGITALVMMGSKVEFTGNVVVDSMFLSAGLVGLCFSVINGVPVAIAYLNAENLCRLILACICAAILVRAIMWVTKGS